MSHRLFSKPKPTELMSRPQSSGGSYHLKTAADLIAYHRRLKRGNLWPRRIHIGLTIALCGAFMAILGGICLCIDSESAGESKAAEKWFSVALWASGAMGVIVLAKVFMNGRYPQA